MAKPAAKWWPRVVAAIRSAAAGIARGGLSILRRVYALALIALILWASWGALRYLIDSLIVPSVPPPQIAAVPRRLDETILRERRPDWLGLDSVENPRGPLAHYHRFETWIQSDRFNDCTRSGCHGPLPHAEKKEVRAFLNLHATSLHCGVCHIDNGAEPLPLTWYDLGDGRTRGRPALLEAFDWLDRHADFAADALGPDAQREIAELLRRAAREGDSEPNLERAALHVAAVRPASQALLQQLELANVAVRRALRGSYGVKLAAADSAGKPVFGHPDTDAAVRDWLTRKPLVEGAERDALLAAVHPRRRTTALSCTDCHRSQGSLLDFARAGYPAGRIRTLTDPTFFSMIEHIAQGRPFHLPTIGTPGSQPARQP